MKKTLLPITFLAVVCLVALSGCPSAPEVKVKDPKVGTKGAISDKFGLDVLRQATDVPHYRDALLLFNGRFQTPEVRERLLGLNEKVRPFLADQVNLTPDELLEVEAVTFRQDDAYHLAECYLLRDAARALDFSGTLRPELAERCFQWVCRHVLLHEQGDDWLPAGHVLRRGHGNGRDRGRVFLGMMRQLQMEGCLLALPGAAPEVVLVGVLPSEGNDLLLFDPRLGQAVRNVEGKVATWKEVVKDPKLLAPSALSEKQLAALEVWLACPLHALAPRMHELERMLANQDRITFHLDAARLADNLTTATGRPARVWNPAAGKGGAVANSPTRALRLFLPPEEGGVDKDGHQASFRRRLIPWPLIQVNLEPIKVLNDLHAGALNGLTERIDNLFRIYDVEPEEMHLRGQNDAVIARLDRARSFLEDPDLAGLADDARFRRELDEWVDKLNRAYIAKNQGEINSLWSEDHFVLLLLHPDNDQRPESRKKQSGALTKLLALAAREPLSQQAGWLRASGWHDKLERAEAQARHGKGAKLAPGQLQKNWINARAPWHIYARDLVPDPAALKERLARLDKGLRNNDPRIDLNALAMLEETHLDLHHYLAARTLQADALRHEGKAKEAEAQLQAVLEEYDALLRDQPKDAKTRPGLRQQSIALLQTLRGRQNPAFPRRLDLLEHDWDAAGHLHWQREHVRLLLQRWQKG